jgi:hypothetical protein
VKAGRFSVALIKSTVSRFRLASRMRWRTVSASSGGIFLLPVVGASLALAFAVSPSRVLVSPLGAPKILSTTALEIGFGVTAALPASGVAWLVVAVAVAVAVAVGAAAGGAAGAFAVGAAVTGFD